MSYSVTVGYQARPGMGHCSGTQCWIDLGTAAATSDADVDGNFVAVVVDKIAAVAGIAAVADFVDDAHDYLPLAMDNCLVVIFGPLRLEPLRSLMAYSYPHFF